MTNNDTVFSLTTNTGVFYGTLEDLRSTLAFCSEPQISELEKTIQQDGHELLYDRIYYAGVGVSAIAIGLVPCIIPLTAAGAAYGYTRRQAIREYKHKIFTCINEERVRRN